MDFVIVEKSLDVVIRFRGLAGFILCLYPMLFYTLIGVEKNSDLNYYLIMRLSGKV